MIDTKAIQHLKRLINTWFRLKIISKNQKVVIDEDIKTFIKIERRKNNE